MKLRPLTNAQNPSKTTKKPKPTKTIKKPKTTKKPKVDKPIDFKPFNAQYEKKLDASLISIFHRIPIELQSLFNDVDILNVKTSSSFIEYTLANDIKFSIKDITRFNKPGQHIVIKHSGKIVLDVFG